MKYKSYKMKTSDSRHNSGMAANNFGPFWSKLFWIKRGISSNVLYENQLHKNVTKMFLKRKKDFFDWVEWVCWDKLFQISLYRLEQSRYCHCKSDLYLRQRLKLLKRWGVLRCQKQLQLHQPLPKYDHWVIGLLCQSFRKSGF